MAAMRTPICHGMIVAALLSPGIAAAHPDGAPWGAAKPSATESCASCHFDSEPVHESAQIHVEGLPANVTPGSTYGLTISLKDPSAVIVGFQMIAEAGTFTSVAANVEFIGAAIRSTIPVTSDGAVSWTLHWHAPSDMMSSIGFFLAASAANDDGSPLGDQIHFRSYTLPAALTQPVY